MKRIAWIIGFFVATPAAIGLSLFLLFSVTKSEIIYPVIPQIKSDSSRVLSAQKEVTQLVSVGAHPSDARPILIMNYLHKYSSPLEPYSQIIVNVSDKYSLDYRLLVAIAQQESNLCKKIPPGSYNCWGYGIYGDLVTRFDSYPEALETVASGLKKNYLDKGLNTPEKIMAKYTPPSIDLGGPWAHGVSSFLSDLE